MIELIKPRLASGRSGLALVLHKAGLAVALLFAIGPGVASAATFGAGIENSRWNLSSSIFECSLSHEIPVLGRAVFYRRAGEALQFYLDVQINPMAPGHAALVIEAPPWRPGASVQDLGYVRVDRSRRPITVPSRTAWRMLASLAEGMVPTFTRQSAYGPDGIRVRLSHVNFTAFNTDFQHCVASLLPVNFDQVGRTSIYFRSNSTSLSPADRESLDKVALYVGADSTVTALYVDGHTDRVGSRLDNRTLSRARAEAVTEYLVQQGVDPAKITTRYHGDRYPAAGATNNRRATIRLQREGEPQNDAVLQQAEAYAAQGPESG